MKNNKQINYLSLLMLSLFVSTQTMSMTINISNQNSSPSTIPTQKSLLCPNISNQNLSPFVITPQRSLLPLPTVPNQNSSPSLNQKVSDGAYAPSSLLIENLGCQPVETFSVPSKLTTSALAPLLLDSLKNASIFKKDVHAFFKNFQKPQDLINALLSTESPQNQTFLKYLILTNNI